MEIITAISSFLKRKRDFIKFQTAHDIQHKRS
jgi:hypothetical protein